MQQNDSPYRFIYNGDLHKSIPEYLYSLKKIKYDAKHEKKIYECAKRHGIFKIMTEEEWDDGETRRIDEILGLKQTYEKILTDSESMGHNSRDYRIIIDYSYVRMFLEECVRMGVHEFYEFGYGDGRIMPIIQYACGGDVRNLTSLLDALSAYNYEHLNHLIITSSYFFNTSRVHEKSFPSYTNPYSRNIFGHGSGGSVTYDVLRLIKNAYECDDDDYSAYVTGDDIPPVDHLLLLKRIGDDVTHLDNFCNVIKHGKNKKRLAKFMKVAWEDLPHDYDEVKNPIGIEKEWARSNPLRSIFTRASDVYLYVTPLDYHLMDERLAEMVGGERIIRTFIGIDTLTKVSRHIPREKHYMRYSEIEYEFFTRLPRTQASEIYISLHFPDYYEEAFNGPSGISALVRGSSEMSLMDYSIICYETNFNDIYKIMRQIPEAYEYLLENPDTMVSESDNTTNIGVFPESESIGYTSNARHKLIKYFFMKEYLKTSPFPVITLSDKMIEASNCVIWKMMADESYALCGKGVGIGHIPLFNHESKGLVVSPTRNCIILYDKMNKFARNLYVSERIDSDKFFLYFIEMNGYHSVLLAKEGEPMSSINVCRFAMGGTWSNPEVIPEYHMGEDDRSEKFLNAMIDVVLEIYTDKYNTTSSYVPTTPEEGDSDQLIELMKESPNLTKIVFLSQSLDSRIVDLFPGSFTRGDRSVYITT